MIFAYTYNLEKSTSGEGRWSMLWSVQVVILIVKTPFMLSGVALFLGRFGRQMSLQKKFWNISFLHLRTCWICLLGLKKKWIWISLLSCFGRSGKREIRIEWGAVGQAFMTYGQRQCVFSRTLQTPKLLLVKRMFLFQPKGSGGSHQSPHITK